MTCSPDPRVRVYLETERMVLREFTTGDAEALYALDSAPGVLRYIAGEPPVTPATASDDLARFLGLYRRYERRFGYWAAHGRAGASSSVGSS